jgi:hypothetical protein
MEEAKKLSITQCRKILEEGGSKYSDEQVRLIREVLYTLGELDYLILKEMKVSGEKGLNQTDSEKAA